MRRLLIVAMVLVAAAGCSRTAVDPPEANIVSQVAAGDTVTLRLGEAAAITGSDVVIRFSALVADTRCPVDVVCVWAGDAHVLLEVLAGGAARERADLHTELEPKAVQREGYVLELVDVAPERKSTVQTTADEYSIRIRVTMS